MKKALTYYHEPWFLEISLEDEYLDVLSHLWVLEQDTNDYHD